LVNFFYSSGLTRVTTKIVVILVVVVILENAEPANVSVYLSCHINLSASEIIFVTAFFIDSER